MFLRLLSLPLRSFILLLLMGEALPVLASVPSTMVAAGTSHSCAITSAGGVMCWGKNSKGQLGNGTTTKSPTPITVTDLTSGATVVSAGTRYSCAIVNGVVMCWGKNGKGQLGDGTSKKKLTPVPVIM